MLLAGRAKQEWQRADRITEEGFDGVFGAAVRLVVGSWG